MGNRISCTDPEYPVPNSLDGKCYKKCPDGFTHRLTDWTKCDPVNAPRPYSRGTGAAPICPDGKEDKHGTLCYPTCPKGLVGKDDRCEYDVRMIGPGVNPK